MRGTFAVCRDVTEIKAREAELERYERAVDGATDLIAAVDREGRFLFANRQYRAYHGIGTGDDVSELTLEDVVDDEQYGDVRGHVDRALDGRSVEYRTTRVHADRGKRTLDVRYYPLVNPVESDGGFAGVVGVLRDVTDSESRARQLRVVDRVLQHNLRNALTVIRGRAEQIAELGPEETGPGVDASADRSEAARTSSPVPTRSSRRARSPTTSPRSSATPPNANRSTSAESSNSSDRSPRRSSRRRSYRSRRRTTARPLPRRRRGSTARSMS
ncbi:PAS domain-containing protein [Halorubrum saccharovorum]|uniref:PAS domain-containing protein n=1 Tax=Halorubrum saccharovorum TaxID=2248 RepID=UPI001F1BCD87|nr:PAS domain-containing protein [Halorubrum saccharovorum]